jgi:hypothetical protein
MVDTKVMVISSVMGSKQTEGILAVGNSFSVAPTWKEYA